MVQPAPLGVNDGGCLQEVRSGVDDESTVSCQVLEGISYVQGTGFDVYLANASSEPLAVPALTQVASQR